VALASSQSKPVDDERDTEGRRSAYRSSPDGIGEIVLTEAHQRDGYRDRGQQHHHGQGQAHGCGYPGAADRIGQQDCEGGSQRKHPRLGPAGETQRPRERPPDQGLEDELGKARRRGYRHRHQHGPAPSARHQADQEQHRGHHDDRQKITEPGQVLQDPPLPAKPAADPGIDPPVERFRPGLPRDQRPQDRRDRRADDQDRSGRGPHRRGH
jgi:hypothetical protein